MPDRIDGIDLGQVLETTRSAGYRLIVERMRDIHLAKGRELRNSALTHDQTQHIRGFLDGIDRCMAIPEALKTEFEARKKLK